MAVTEQYSDQYELGYIAGKKNPPSDIAGRLRIYRFDCTQTDDSGDPGSSFLLGKLPAGRVRLLGFSSFLAPRVTGTSAIEIGWDAYHDWEGNEKPAASNGIGYRETSVSEKVGTMGSALLNESGDIVFESKDGVDIRLTYSAQLVVGDTVKGHMVYVVD